jgi:hypothetical protein
VPVLFAIFAIKVSKCALVYYVCRSEWRNQNFVAGVSNGCVWCNPTTHNVRPTATLQC